MSRILPIHAVVVVADGVSARYFRVAGHQPALHLSEAEHLKPMHLTGEGPSGHRPKESSQQETDEATFVKQLANDLVRRVHAHEFTALVLVADPHTLGTLRPLLHKDVQHCVVLEIAKSFTHAPIADIQKMLTTAA